jgi:iron complex outermembrane receptor protein
MYMTSALALLLGTSALTALGQPAELPEENSETGDTVRVLGQVTVSARRREETLQEVPIAVTTISSDQMLEQVIQDTSDLTSALPGIRFANSGTTAGPAVSARGQGRLPLGEYSGAVVIYFAEVPMPNEGVFIPTYDLENIQGLKGPQGTLFGRNALTGAVLLTPKAPSYDFGGEIAVGAGDFNYRKVGGVLNVPIVEDKAALRIAGEYRKRDGYVDIVGRDDDAYNQDRLSLRASLLLEPTADLQNVTILDYLDSDEVGGTPFLTYTIPTGLVYGIGLGPAVDAAVAAQQDLGPYAIQINGENYEKRELFGLTNKTTFDLGNVKLVNIFGYRRSELDSRTDTDGTLLLLNHVGGPRSNEQYTEEFQVQGSGFDDKLNWIAGTFFYWKNSLNEQGNRSDVLALGPWREAYDERRSQAVYGQLDYDLSDILDGLTLTGGLRQTWDQLEICSLTAAGSTTEMPPIGPDGCAAYDGGGVFPPSSTVDDKYEATTYTLAANYQYLDGHSVYVTHRKGFREGGINSPQFTTAGVTNNPPCPGGGTLCRDLRPYQAFSPQTTLDYEIGFKSLFQWSNGVQASMNVAFYQADHEDIQSVAVLGGLINPSDPGLPPFGALTYNGGTIRTKGVEADLVVQPIDGLRLFANLNYSDGEQVEPNMLDIVGFAPSSSQLQEVLDYGFGASYRIPLGDGRSSLSAAADWFHKDAVFSGDPATTVPAYDVVNARLAWESALGSSIDLSVFARNLLDEEYIFNTASAAPAFGFTTFHRGEPRILGIEATYRFGAE